MRRSDQMHAIRQALSELAQAQVTAALCVSQLQDLVSVDHPDATPHIAGMPRADAGTFSVIWRSRRCHLGHTKCFRLFTRLLRRANQYVPYEQLLRDVWDGDVKSPDTVRSAVRELRSKLVRARMRRLASAIRAQGQHYGLIFGGD